MDNASLRRGEVWLVVFDPSQIGPGLPHGASDLPAGAKRLTQKATGIRATVVNGQVLMRDGEHSGALPGQLIRCGQIAGCGRGRTHAGPPNALALGQSVR